MARLLNHIWEFFRKFPLSSGKWNILILFISMGLLYQTQVDVYDNFESSALRNIWSSSRMVATSFEVQSKIVREGKGAAKITLRTGDVVEPGNDSSLASERDELEEADYLVCREGIKYEYQFSLFLPDSFPIVPTRLIIAQWKEKCPHRLCSDDSPVLAIRYQSGKLFITLTTDSGRRRLYELTDEIRNRWLDFKFQVRFSNQGNGEIEAFLNGKHIIHYKGITGYTEGRDYYAKNNTFYFKMGLYRDRMPEPMSIYIDEYRKKEIVENQK
jgi:hypothetical protein